jgi:hypothetical protein
MVDAEPAAPVPSAGTEDSGPGAAPAAPVRCSVPEAARALGISERAVRKRIGAGTLRAERDGRAWAVELPIAVGTARPAVPAAPVTIVPEPPEPGAVPEAAPAAVPGGTDLRPLVDHIADLERRVERLTESSTAWQFRALAAEQQLKELGAGDVATPYDAPTAAPAPPGAAGGAGGAEPAQDARPWWRRWLGLG